MRSFSVKVLELGLCYHAKFGTKTSHKLTSHKTSKQENLSFRIGMRSFKLN